MVTSLYQRASCNPSESGELLGVERTESFGHVAGRGTRRLSDLLRKFDISCGPAIVRQLDDLVSKLRRKLPADQVFVFRRDGGPCGKVIADYVPLKNVIIRSD